nr:MAG TPA: hypothetical protein [Caudoviricetes sp.]
MDREPKGGAHILSMPAIPTDVPWLKTEEDCS